MDDPRGAHQERAPHTVPLCPLALAELEAVWPARTRRAGRAASAAARRRAGGGLRGFSKLKARLDALSGVADWRWHDLRRTARTGMTRLGVPRDHAEAAINHVSGRSALERTYDRHDYAEETAVALSRWQAHVAALYGHGRVMVGRCVSLPRGWGGRLRDKVAKRAPEAERGRVFAEAR